MNPLEQENFGEETPEYKKAPRSVREVFEASPFESDAPPPSDQEETNGTGDILQAYFREMGEVAPLTAAQEADVWNKIDQCLNSIRKILFRFGFVFEEHIRLLNDTELDDLDDIFPSEQKDSFSRDFQKRKQWSAKISAVYEELSALYAEHAAPALQKELREKGYAILMEHPAMPGELQEWHDVALHYLLRFQEGHCPHAELEQKMLCSAAEFEDGVRQISRLREDYEKWKSRMIETNLRLVISIAKRYQKKGLPLGDLIQEGNLGLMKALERFNYHLGHRFCTYASWWIHQGVVRALSAQSRVIRLPVHMIETIRKMTIAEKNFIQANGTEPTDADIAKALDFSVERVRAIRKMAVQCLSLQAPAGDSSENTAVENFLSDKESDDPMRLYAKKIMSERLNAAMRLLSERERQIITMRYGLDGEPCKSLTEVSAAFNVTRERVRQIELKTLDKLRKHSDCGRTLDDFFL